MMKLTGSKVFLRFYETADAEALLDLHIRNQEFFQKYSPTFADDFYTIEAKHKFIIDSKTNRDEDKSYSFGIFDKESGELAGDVSLNRIVRGSLQRGLIGYSLDQRYNGRGFTSEAVSLAVDYAFNVLKLHRVDAGVMLSNAGSMRVLEKSGFQREGIERKGVKINGQWEDHQIFAIISETN